MKPASDQDGTPEAARTMLRHTVATLAYRAAKALREAPDGFAAFRASATSRTPGEILAHMGDLMDWALSQARGAQEWNDSTPGEWDADKSRFFAALQALDDHLAAGEPLGYAPERIFQGAVADALTHVGQHRRFVEAGRVLALVGDDLRSFQFTHQIRAHDRGRFFFFLFRHRFGFGFFFSSRFSFFFGGRFLFGFSRWFRSRFFSGRFLARRRLGSGPTGRDEQGHQ
jgi:hypothetical protein